jgi:hypothetical protein
MGNRYEERVLSEMFWLLLMFLQYAEEHVYLANEEPVTTPTTHGYYYAGYLTGTDVCFNVRKYANLSFQLLIYVLLAFPFMDQEQPPLLLSIPLEDGSIPYVTLKIMTFLQEMMVRY